MKILLLAVSCLPSLLQKPLRRLLGAKIEASASIGIFAFVLTRDLIMGNEAKIASFVALKAETVKLGERARIRPLSILKVRRLEIGDSTLIDPLVLVNCTYGPRSQLRIGRHSRVQSFSQLEPSEGIFIGDHVALGGHSLVFCHGSWSNYLRGSPYSRGPVHIEDEVWVSWRSMILANSHIGARAIIGAHSMVHGKVASGSLYVGVPARMVLDKAWKVLTPEEREKRMLEIVAAFRTEYESAAHSAIRFADITEGGIYPQVAGGHAVLYSFRPLPKGEYATGSNSRTVIDFENLIAYGTTGEGLLFVDFLETYGVRMDRKPLSAL